MRYGRYGWSYLLLRLGLGATFAWIGVDIFRHPETWIGFIPENLPLGVSRVDALPIAGGVDIALGLLLIFNHLPKFTTFLASIHLVGIIAWHGVDALIVRDIGLLGAALSLLMWPQHRRKGFKIFDKLPFRGGSDD